MSYYLYKHLGENNEILYVGFTSNMKTRTNNHKYSSHWFGRVVRVEYRRLYKRALVQESERLAILFLRPTYNKMRNVWKQFDELPCEPSKKQLALIKTNKVLFLHGA